MALVVCVSLTGALLIQPRVGSPAKGCRARLIMTDVPPAPPDDSVTDCLVVGSGIWVTRAHNLNRAGVDVVLAEARDYVGGNVKSHNDDGFIWEEGPNSFATQPSIVRIADELGIADELVFANEALPPWVNHGGKLHPLPKGQGGKGPKGQLELVFGPNGVLKFALLGELLSWPGKIRAGIGAFLGHAPAPKPKKKQSASGLHAFLEKRCSCAASTHSSPACTPVTHRRSRCARPAQDRTHRAVLVQYRVEPVRRDLLRWASPPSRAYKGAQGQPARPGMARI